MCSDLELFNNLTEMNLVKRIDKNPEHMFEHRHWCGGKRCQDQVDAAINGQLFTDDKATYAIRKNLSLEERLKG